MQTVSKREAYEYQQKGATCLKGYLLTSYDELVEVFGQPTRTASDFGDGKVRAEWAVKVNDKIVFIYDYKEYDRDVKDVIIWHLGARSLNDIIALKYELKQSGITFEKDVKLDRM